MNLLLWMLLNLGVPIIGPIFTLALVAPAHGWAVAKELIADSVKDGQLFWCAIGLCAAGVYELVTALEQGGRAVAVLEFGMVTFCLLAFVCSIIVMSCLLNAHYGRVARRVSHHSTQPTGGSFSRVAIGCSIVSTCVSAILLAILHIYVSRFIG